MTTRLFGRSWNVQVLTPANSANQQTLLNVSSSDRETSSLRVTFDIEQMAFSNAFYAEVKIYNPDLQTIGTLNTGCVVSVAAGYESEGAPGEIFRGPVFQAIFSKEEAHTVVVKLICMVGLQQQTDNYVSATVGPNATQRQTVLAMAANCLGSGGTPAPIPIAYLAPDSDFKANALPRSQTIFGTPNKLFADIAKSNDMVSFMGPDGLYLGKLDGARKSTPDVIYAPPLTEAQTQAPSDGTIRYCLIGTPEQTQLGVDFRVLLDSRLTARVPAMQAQLKNAVIEQARFQINQYQSLLTQDGVYFVIGVRHVGDTRGDLWESQVTGVTSAAGVLAILGVSA